MDRFMETMYQGHSFAIPILGYHESVAGIKQKDIREFYEQWYFDQTVTISISGRVKADEVLPVLEAALGKKTLTKSIKPEKVERKTLKHSVRYHREVDQGQMILGVQAPGLEDPDRIAIQVMNAILGGNEISRLFQRIREEKGLAYAVDTSHECWLDVGCFLVSVGLDHRKMGEVEKIIVEEWERMMRDPVTDEELMVARNSLEGAKIMELEGAGAYNSYMGAMAVRGLPADPEEELTLIQEVTIEDVQRVANRILDPKNYVLTALLPKKGKGR